MMAHLLSKFHSLEPVNGIPVQCNHEVNSSLVVCSTSTGLPFLRQIGNGSISSASRRLKPLFSPVPRSDVFVILVTISFFIGWKEIPKIVLRLHLFGHALDMASILFPKSYHLTDR